MSERVKFRVWNESGKRFTFFDGKPEFQIGIDSQDDPNYRSGLLIPSGYPVYLGGYSGLEQCTGIRDKNGKLIYEGDRVKLAENIIGGENMTVKFGEDDGMWIMEDEESGGWEPLYHHGNIEIIGHIHEEIKNDNP